MTTWTVGKATTLVTVAMSNTDYKVREFMNLRAIYGHVSHKDDVINDSMGSPFICRNVKSGCVRRAGPQR